MDAGRFESLGSEILSVIDTLKQYSGAPEKRLGQIAENIRCGSFTLAVAGQFKRGKTTLINALLGMGLLPTGVVPLTSIVTYVRYSPEIKARVKLAGGEEKAIAIDEISQYVTEKHNPKNIKGVQEVDVWVPSAFLRNGVVIVDTPGIGSTHAHNTEVTRRFLPEADAVIFVLSGDPPITESECRFLEESAKYASKFFFVLNKIDYYEEHEVAELAEFNRGVLASRLGVRQDDVRLYPLSAKRSLGRKLAGLTHENDGLTEFENALAEYISSNKGVLILQSAVSKLRYFTDELINQRQIERSSLSASAAQLEERVKKFDAELKRILSKKEYMGDFVAVEQKKIMSIIDDDINELKRAVTASLEQQIVEFAQSLKTTDNYKYAVEVEEYSNDHILDVLEPWRTKEEEKVAGIYAEKMNKYSGEINAIIEEVEKTASGLFDVKIESRKTEEKFTLESAFYFKLGRIEEGTGLSMLEMVLPHPLFRKKLLANLPDYIREDLDRNCGRVRYDFYERIQKSSLVFIEMLDDKVDAAINGIRSASENALKLRAQGNEKVRERIAQLDTELSHLRRLQDRLASINPHVV
ncbi:MAG: dynamin family protein [Candidatus Micrarchaeia archaeon]